MPPTGWESHRRYVRDLHRFMAELARIEDADDRERLLVERRQEIADAAHDLQRSTRRWLGRNMAAFSIGLAGAAWDLIRGDPVGFVLDVGNLVTDIAPGHSVPITAYSYIFEVRQQFGDRISRW